MIKKIFKVVATFVATYITVLLLSFHIVKSIIYHYGSPFIISGLDVAVFSFMYFVIIFAKFYVDQMVVCICEKKYIDLVIYITLIYLDFDIISKIWNYF